MYRLVPSAALLAVALLACSSTPPVEEVPSAEGYYQSALETLEGRRAFLFFHDVDYDRAIELFQEVIDNYPYSEYATLAELKIADVHFDQENYEESASYYQDFVELHPNHPQVPYAIYRNGLCSYERIGRIDQDQSATQEAIDQFRVLVERYPTSQEASDAAQRLQDSIDRLAAHEVEVGLFYYQRGDYHASVKRFREALVKYPEHTSRLHTMVRLGNSLKHLRRYEEAEQVFQQVLAIRPAEGLGDQGEDELMELGMGLSQSRRAGGRLCLNYPSPACARELPDVQAELVEEPVPLPDPPEN